MSVVVVVGGGGDEDGGERIAGGDVGVDGMIEIEAEAEREIEWSSDDDYCGDYPTTRLLDFHRHRYSRYSHCR